MPKICTGMCASLHLKHVVFFFFSQNLNMLMYICELPQCMFLENPASKFLSCCGQTDKTWQR